MIRAASRKDAQSIAVLSGQLGYPARVPEVEQRIEQLFESDANRVWLDERAGTVVGWLQASKRFLIESEAYVEIAGLVVDDRHRGQGVGSGLVRQAEEWAKQAGFAALRVRTNVLREAAHRFYAKEGFEVVKGQTVFVKNL